MASNCGCPACPLLPSLLVTRRQRSYYRLPAINATGRPALGRRRSRLRTRKAACFTLAALDDSHLPVSLRARSTLRPAAAADQSRGSVLVLNTEHSTSEHFGCPLSMAYAATPLRPGARYARILAYGLPCPTLGRHPGAGPSLGGDIHDRCWLSVNLFLPMAKTTRTSSRPSSSSSGVDVPPRFNWLRFG